MNQDKWDAINDGPYNEEPPQQEILPILVGKIHDRVPTEREPLGER